jgi:homoserine O-acetyltransferase/O-succinyltransferase
MTDGTSTFELGNVALQSGDVLEGARLVYATFGELNASRDNVVLFPTYYTGTHRENAAMIGKGRALDPERHFIVIPNMFGNGVSSSPSNHEPQRGAAFPRVTVFDNVQCHRRLLDEVFGVARVALAFGWSMGAQQAYHYAALFPDHVAALLAVCGSARTSAHNWVFLEGIKAALLADPDFDGGRYVRPPKRGLAAFGRVYAGWAYSEAFFRKGLFREVGCDSASALLDAWAREHEAWDANDLLAMLYAWQHADIGDNSVHRGDYERALGAITARTIVMPATTDLYFPKEDSAIEVSHLRNGELRVIETDWGHVGGGPNRNRDATTVIERAIADLMRT